MIERRERQARPEQIGQERLRNFLRDLRGLGVNNFLSTKAQNEP
jgi:hypothetical protein